MGRVHSKAHLNTKTPGSPQYFPKRIFSRGKKWAFHEKRSQTTPFHLEFIIMLNLLLLLACVQVLLAGSECQIILMGGSPGSGAKVVSIYWIATEEGQLLWAVNSSQKQRCACVDSNLQPGKNRPGVQKMAQCGNGETAKHPAIMCWPATKPDRKAW